MNKKVIEKLSLYKRTIIKQRKQLFPLEHEGLGEFEPLAVLGYFEGTACFLLEEVGGVGLEGERGFEVFAAEVVDEVHACLVVALHLRFHYHPTEGVAFSA